MAQAPVMTTPFGAGCWLFVYRGQNTFLGKDAGVSMTSGSKNVIVGKYTGNNDSQTSAQPAIKIVLSDGDGNVSFRANNNQSIVMPGYGGSGGKTPQANSSLAVFKDGTTTRVLHSENLHNSSGAENYRSFLGSNCNNSSSYHFHRQHQWWR